MADFAKLAQTAKRLIEKNGRDVVVVRRGATPADPAKPWDLTGATGEVTVTGRGVVVDPATLGTMTTNAEILRSEQVVLFAAANDSGYDLTTFDAVRDGGVEWRVTTVRLLRPAATRVLYMIGVSR